MARAMNQSACSVKMRDLLIAVLCAIMQTIAVPSGWAEDASAESPAAQKDAAPSGDANDIQSRGGFRDPIGPYGATPEEKDPAASEDIRSRGLTGKLKTKPLDLKRRPQPGGTPPAHLCRTETKMLTQCKCSNQAECQALTALFPNSCPAGSQHCEFIPMSRGTMPPLPPNLCGYQVPLTVTECSCHNATECQQLTPFCTGTCPAGSQSCTCRPMRRG